MILYKLTNQDFTTRKGESNKTLWGENVTHEAKGLGEVLCSDGFIHAYEHPLIAILMNPLHANLKEPILWECEGEGKILRDFQLKCGIKKLTTLKQIPIPDISIEQKIRFAIKCALTVNQKASFKTWAMNWLENRDRTTEAAINVNRSTYRRSNAAYSAYSATLAASPIHCLENQELNVAYAAVGAYDATRNAATARAGSYDATRNANTINLIAIAEWAISNQPL